MAFLWTLFRLFQFLRLPAKREDKPAGNRTELGCEQYVSYTDVQQILVDPALLGKLDVAMCMLRDS